MRFIRRLIAYSLFCFAWPLLFAHPKLRSGIKRRLGLHPASWPNFTKGPRIWLHGASAGDILALKPLALELRQLQPQVNIALTTITNSGHAMAAKLGQVFSTITYAPYDLMGPVKRTINKLQPNVLVLEYTELWPELIDSAHRAGTRLVLHNGRFSAERISNYRILFALVGNLLERFDLLLMRDEYEAERAQRLGVAVNRIVITGNTKFDNLVIEVSANQLQELEKALAFPEKSHIWVAGSTHEGEEELLLDVYVTLRKNHPLLKLVIAPRYTERASRIISLAQRRNLKARTHSSTPAVSSDVVVIDTIGELVACYSLADSVFVGGSFITRGGQNILEPAACGKPVIFGPHMENFTDAVQALLGRGGLQVASSKQLTRILSDLIERESYRNELGELARTQVSKIRGAAKRNAELILGLL
ncbi:MAG: 3-deoxy-D-manno-octulosonic acid transferase [Deltaproteobacteria bacterium]|nr:3-deoxy-D-manno-octulosonic acid transferase [Deltaproteobacteria bacterium]